MKILLIEDDSFLEKDLVKTLTKTHPNIAVEWLETERAFHDSLPAICENPPDLIILDVMLPWDYARPDVTLPPEPRSADDFRYGGLWIYQALQGVEALASIPVIFHSVYDAEYLRSHLGDRPPHVLILPKSSASVNDILITVRSLVPNQKYAEPPPKNWFQRFYDALEIKFGVFGIKVDVKKI